MTPRLYESTETDFEYGAVMARLSSTIMCEVTEERNSIYELIMKYPVNGVHFSDIQVERIIGVISFAGSDIQPFRIYRISKPINGIVTIYGEHISYMLANLPIGPFSSTYHNVVTLLNRINTAREEINTGLSLNFPTFSVRSDIVESVSQTYTKNNISSARDFLLGSEGSVLDRHHGEYEWDKWTVYLHSARGSDNGFTVKYAKNMTGMDVDEDMSSVYTGVCPFWIREENGVVDMQRLDYYVTPSASSHYSSFTYPLIKMLDVSGEYENKPTKAQLQSRAEAWMAINSSYNLVATIKASFVPLWQTDEYKDFSDSNLKLCDTVTIQHQDLGVDIKTKVIKTVFNSLTERYEEIGLGTARMTMNQLIKEVASK